MSVVPRLRNPAVRAGKCPSRRSGAHSGVPRLGRRRESPNFRTSHLKLGAQIAGKFSLDMTQHQLCGHRTATHTSLPLKWSHPRHQGIFPGLRGLFCFCAGIPGETSFPVIPGRKHLLCKAKKSQLLTESLWGSVLPGEHAAPPPCRTPSLRSSL